jgi:hypothetical protein
MVVSTAATIASLPLEIVEDRTQIAIELVDRQGKRVPDARKMASDYG